MQPKLKWCKICSLWDNTQTKRKLRTICTLFNYVRCVCVCVRVRARSPVLRLI